MLEKYIFRIWPHGVILLRFLGNHFVGITNPAIPNIVALKNESHKMKNLKTFKNKSEKWKNGIWFYAIYITFVWAGYAVIKNLNMLLFFFFQYDSPFSS